MPFFETTEELLARIDKRSDKLIDEFHEHREEFEAKHGPTDHRLIYEGWMIQKVAGLQILVEELNDRLRLLGSRMPRR